MTQEISLGEFSEQLASKAPTPGGGGAAAAVGALACALGEMVCNLTLGKERYAQVADEVEGICARLGKRRAELLELVDEDARAFRPLAKAYSIPKDDPMREEVMESALMGACAPPLQMMAAVADIVSDLERLAQVGSRLAVSDVAVGATCARSALEGASLNVYINAGSMTDRASAREVVRRADALLADASPRAEAVFRSVLSQLKG